MNINAESLMAEIIGLQYFKKQLLISKWTVLAFLNRSKTVIPNTFSNLFRLIIVASTVFGSFYRAFAKLPTVREGKHAESLNTWIQLLIRVLATGGVLIVRLGRGLFFANDEREIYRT